MWNVIKIVGSAVVSAIISTLSTLTLKSWGVLDPIAMFLGAWLKVQPVIFWYTLGLLLSVILWLVFLFIARKRSNEIDHSGSTSEYLSNDSEWLSLADAAHYCYELLGKYPELSTKKSVFELNGRERSSFGPSWAFRIYILDHAHRDVFKVRGKVKGGTTIAALPLIAEEAHEDWVYQAEITQAANVPDELALPGGGSLEELQVRRDSIDNFIEYLREISN